MPHAVIRRQLAVALLLAAGPALGGDVFVVTRADIRLSIDDVRDVFLGEKEFVGTVRLVPIDNQAVQAEFAAKALSMSAQRYTQLWVKKAFRDALTPPVVIAGDAEVIEFVKRTRGAIGYVQSAPRDKDIAVVGKY